METEAIIVLSLTATALAFIVSYVLINYKKIIWPKAKKHTVIEGDLKFHFFFDNKPDNLKLVNLAQSAFRSFILAKEASAQVLGWTNFQREFVIYFSEKPFKKGGDRQAYYDNAIAYADYTGARITGSGLPKINIRPAWLDYQIQHCEPLAHELLHHFSNTNEGTFDALHKNNKLWLSENKNNVEEVIRQLKTK